LKWWESKEYDRAQAMNFPAAGGRMRRIGKTVSYDTAQGRWVSTPIRVYIGPSFR
jgi:hypothetical protein